MDTVTSVPVPDLRVQLGPLALANPVMTASGTFGYAAEFAHLVPLASLGAVVVKGISLHPRPGNPPPRIVETPCGMLNAIGLENVGVERFISDKMPFLRTCGCRVVVNILGDSIEEYAALAAALSDVAGIDALEVNISCPNVKKGGVAFGTVPEMAAAVTAAVKRVTTLPVIVKLSPNVTDIVAMARAVADGGADALSLINTLIGMAIDARTRRPKLANVIGGLSGPAVKPVALRMVWQVTSSVSIPVIGIGGIGTPEDAIEFLLAGASAVQVGTANFYNPAAVSQILAGIETYLRDQGETSVRSIIGGLRLSK
ncbi:dihydroorotate oxidase B, catalytic subunit [Desulfobulbus propionicus DSM 2032]|jgi:dihydroorotate dehydrogenase (NAD+) catalytic subunit|uniref:Dihydroorotate dehydrogenase n=1 Tax=Desulfobulbus propionicus (strain ATCC 33891 / DSM 2032 / VKM B-1956 / 1pr3) TaxID=577650 RepID=A0A7U3YJD2_DESPD|nr:dihydroorotate dehydrogenase [Desulfobulbus propionicus]ADW16476.1 dihydroorotate oxidase B, catalytic subunit [Desulfobulbus propionicus DSM 2032]